MANKVKHNKFTTIIYVVIILLVLVAVAGVIIHFTRNSQTPPAEEGILSVSIDGENVANGSSAGTLVSGTVIAVDGATDCSVAVYAYCSDNDFELTVDGDVYYWSEFTDLNVTEGFTFSTAENGFEVKYTGFTDIVSKSQSGAEVNAVDMVSGNIFRMVITSGESEFEFFFGISAEIADIALDIYHIVF